MGKSGKTIHRVSFPTQISQFWDTEKYSSQVRPRHSTLLYRRAGKTTLRHLLLGGSTPVAQPPPTPGLDSSDLFTFPVDDPSAWQTETASISSRRPSSSLRSRPQRGQRSPLQRDNSLKHREVRGHRYRGTTVSDTERSEVTVTEGHEPPDTERSEVTVTEGHEPQIQIGQRSPSQRDTSLRYREVRGHRHRGTRASDTERSEVTVTEGQQSQIQRGQRSPSQRDNSLRHREVRGHRHRGTRVSRYREVRGHRHRGTRVSDVERSEVTVTEGHEPQTQRGQRSPSQRDTSLRHREVRGHRHRGTRVSDTDRAEVTVTEGQQSQTQRGQRSPSQRDTSLRYREVRGHRHRGTTVSDTERSEVTVTEGHEPQIQRGQRSPSQRDTSLRYR